MLPWIAEFFTRLGEILSGPFGGLLGGAVSFVVLELWVRNKRQRHQIAEALAAELANAAGDLKVHIDDPDPQEIPGYFRVSHVVFDALANRLGELQFHDVVSVTKVYGTLDELNRMPVAWRERASNAYSLPPNHPVREAELPILQEDRLGFYRTLQASHNDCRGLATHLRTKYALGVRGLVPLRLRPNETIDT